jgi:glycosyltransferase involved in cell wall biosynthesis
VRIAFIHPDAPESEGTGASHSATQIIKGLKHRGHEVVVYCCNPEGEEIDAFDTRVLRYQEDFPKIPRKAMNTTIESRVSEFEEFDIVHSYLMRTIPAITTIGSRGVSTVVTLNAYGGICPKNDLRFLGRSPCHRNGPLRCAACGLQERIENPVGDNRLGQALRVAYNPVKRIRQLRWINRGMADIEYISKFHALSSHVKHKYVEFGVDENSIRVIPNILDDRFRVAHGSNFTSPYDILHVGQLHQHKGVDRLIPIVARLRAEHGIDASLTVVGDGERREYIRNQMDEYGVAGHVTLRGHVKYTNLPEVYASHDLFLYPGEWDEPFGRVFLESMAAGTPIVATDVGATREIIGGAGTIVKNDTDELLEGLAETLDPDTLRRYSEEAGRRITDYERSEIIQQFESLYGDVLESGRSDVNPV